MAHMNPSMLQKVDQLRLKSEWIPGASKKFRVKRTYGSRTVAEWEFEYSGEMNQWACCSRRYNPMKDHQLYHPSKDGIPADVHLAAKDFLLKHLRVS